MKSEKEGEKMADFTRIVDNYFPKLEMYTLPLTRAHGKNHPEVFRVHELFQLMNEKVKENTASKVKLDKEFSELRQVTNHYTLPSDACETYEAVYSMLAEADEVYYQQ